MTLKAAKDVHRGDLVSRDGFWLEVIRVNPTQNPAFIQILFLNGKSVLMKPDEQVLVLDR
jgi:hypothetical protein